MTIEYNFYHYFKIFAQKEQKYENNHRIIFYIYEKIIGCYRWVLMYFNKTYIDIVKDKNYICRELEQYFKDIKTILEICRYY